MILCVKYIFFVNLCVLIALKERCYFALVEIYFHLISMGAICCGSGEEYRPNEWETLMCISVVQDSESSDNDCYARVPCCLC